MAQYSTEEVVIPQQFPASVRVLVVDHDITLLNFINQICIRCHYSVTTCSQVVAALLLLKERKGGFDVILVDVHMPDMDGYYFLQHVSQEWKIPVIMMSTDATTSAVMKAIKHGACDYWIKPLHEEQFRSMWQHVARKAFSENKQDEILGMMEVVGGQRKRDHSEFASTEGVTNATKDSASKEAQACVVENEKDKDKDSTSYPPPAKKPRRVWSPELHQEFVKAVRQLGPDKAVPKRIVEVMKVPGLTREHVASHLQKYRHYLKKSIEKQKNRMPKEVPGTIESKVGGSGRRFEFQNGNPQVPNTARNFSQSSMIIDDLSSRYGATLLSTLPLQQLPHQPVLNVQINSFNSLNYVNPASSINQIFGYNRNSFDSNNPFIIPQSFHPPVRQQLPNSDLRNATLRSSPSLSSRPTGLEMVSSPDIDNINTTTMEVPESTVNNPDEDQPFS